jgi:predicted nucleic acid-binding protein
VLWLHDAAVASRRLSPAASSRERKYTANLRMPVNDSWIAATAISLGVPVVTQDDNYAEAPGLAVIHV